MNKHELKSLLENIYYTLTQEGFIPPPPLGTGSEQWPTEFPDVAPPPPPPPPPIPLDNNNNPLFTQDQWTRYLEFVRLGDPNNPDFQRLRLEIYKWRLQQLLDRKQNPGL